jgi:type IV secretion system protein VirD4
MAQGADRDDRSSEGTFNPGTLYKLFWTFSKDFRRDRNEEFFAEHGRPHPWTPEGRRHDAAVREFRALKENPPQVHGSARWMSTDEARELEAELNSRQAGVNPPIDQLYLGLSVDAKGDPIAILPSANEGHLITVAGTRAGKGTGQIIPNLLMIPRPMFVIDPKGENYAITADARRRMGPVYRFDPFRVTEAHDPATPFARYNPLHFVRDGSDATSLAAMLLGDPPRDASGNARFFYSAALNLLRALLLYVSRSDLPTLGVARETIGLPETQLAEALALLAGDPDPVVARNVNIYLTGSPEMRGSILAEVSNGLALWDEKQIEDATATSDFNLEDMKRQIMTVYVVLPLDKMESHRALLRMMVSQFYSAMIRDGKPARFPVFALIDEFPALGRMEEIVRALGAIAGYNVRLWLFAQDVFRLRSLYGEDANTIFANCLTQSFFGISDGETANWLSQQLGSRTVAAETPGMNTSISPARGGKDQSSQLLSGSAAMQQGLQFFPEPLMSPQQIVELLGVGTYQGITRLGGRPWARLGLVPWYLMPEIKDEGRNLREQEKAGVAQRAPEQWGIHPVRDDRDGRPS